MIPKTIFLFLLCGLGLCLLGCADKEKKEEKADLTQIKENREGLDYRTAGDNLFEKIDELLKRWQEAHKKQDAALIMHTERELEEVSRGNFSEIVKALEGPKGYAAIAALGFTDDVRAIPYLNEVLKKGNPTDRSNAALAIGHIGSPDTPMEGLFEAMKTDSDDSVRSMATFAVAQIITKEKDQGALPHLLTALQDKSPGVRNHAIIALAKIGQKEGGRAILANALRDEYPQIRYNAIVALVMIGDLEACKIPLVMMMRDSDPQVGNAAYAALKELTGKDFGPNPEKWEEWAEIGKK